MYVSDFGSLGPKRWLNDRIIDNALIAIAEQFPKEYREKLHIFSAIYFEFISNSTRDHANYCYDVLVEKELIVFPICQNEHWVLAVVRYSKNMSK